MKVLILLSPICFLILFSCTQNCKEKEEEVKTIMHTWYKKKINFPRNIEYLSFEKITQPNKNKVENKVPTLKKYTIVHFFTADCDKCIDELKLIISSIQRHPINNNVDYIFIASAPTKKYVVDAITETNFPYPVYYEKEYYSFKKMNHLPLNDEIFNTMILNKKQEVILFGGFYANEKAQKLFRNIVECGL